MEDDRATFAFDLPGGLRDAEPVDMPIDWSADDGGHGKPVPQIEIGSDPDKVFDAAVFRVLAEAKGRTTEEDQLKSQNGDTEGSLHTELVPDDLFAPALSRISAHPAKAGKKRLSSAALISVLVHSAVFAAAINIARAIPEPPQEAGSVTVSVVSIGNGDVDALAAGSEDMMANPVEVEAQPVEVETATAAQPVEAAKVPEMEALPPVEQAETPNITEAQPVQAVASPEPDILSVAPSAAEIPQSVAPSLAAVVPETAEPVENPAIAAAQPFDESLPRPETEAQAAVSVAEPIEAGTFEAEAIKAQEDNPEVALDIAAPVPQPSPWRSEPVPQDQVAARQAAERQQQRERQVRQQRQKVAAGSGGNSNANAARGAATGSSQSGSSQGAEATARASDNGAAAMANYAGKVGSRIRRSVGNSRYYRGVGRLSTTVTVNVTVSRSGQIAGVSLARSSGNGEVDSIVVQRARAAGPFGAFPSSYRGSRHSFSLPIRLNLR